MSGKETIYEVRPDDIVKSLIVRVSKRELISTKFFRLLFMGCALDSRKHISDYFLNWDCKIFMDRKLWGSPTSGLPMMIINVLAPAMYKTGEVTYHIGFMDPSTTTISDLKRGIGEKYSMLTVNCVICGHRESRELISPRDWTSEPLLETMTLRQHGVKNDDWVIMRPRIDLLPRGFKVNVTSVSGRADESV